MLSSLFIFVYNQLSKFYLTFHLSDFDSSFSPRMWLMKLSRIPRLDFYMDRYNTGVLRDKTMDDKLIYIPNYDKQYYHFCRFDYLLKRLDTSSLEPINQNLIKVPKVLTPNNKITWLWIFGYQRNFKSIVPRWSKSLHRLWRHTIE